MSHTDAARHLSTVHQPSTLIHGFYACNLQLAQTFLLSGSLPSRVCSLPYEHKNTNHSEHAFDATSSCTSDAGTQRRWSVETLFLTGLETRQTRQPDYLSYLPT